MRIVVAHNFYLQPGGEDRIFDSEATLLERHGHTVIRHTVGNQSVLGRNPVGTAAAAVWNRHASRELASLIQRGRPEVVHFHNTFPVLSPACYRAARRGGASVVQTLQNYRLLCPGALLERGGAPCESCLGKTLAWRGVVHGCYRHSRAATAAVAGMTAIHRMAGTWAEAVDVYLAPTQFSIPLFVAGGLPAAKVVAKPNFVWPDPGPGTGSGGYPLFCGRFSAEKGLATLARAWEHLGGCPPLRAAGYGPDAQALQGAPGIELLGRRSRAEVVALMQEAAFLVFPSVWYEGLPMTIVEAFACGLPVIASRLGAMEELIEDGRTGLLFTPGDASDLAAKVEWAMAHTAEMGRMRREARAEFEARYTAARNYQALMEIYDRARAARN
jgi:glycosyltransferase involved in cell wall biosynthesis